MKKINLVNTSDSMAKWRWYYDAENKVLHRVQTVSKYVDLEEIDKDNYWYALFDGETVCGKQVIDEAPCPGIFQRIHAPRCSVCCQILGIEEGEGIPFNQKITEPDIVYVKE